MFSLSNVKKLFSYNWADTIKQIIPNGQKNKMSDESYQNLKNGSIIRIIAIVFAEVAAIGIALYTVSKAYSWLYGNEIMKYAFKIVLKEGMVKYITQIITYSWFPILLLVYIHIMRRKEQSAWPYFIILIFALIYTLSSIYGAIDWITAIPVSPLFAVAGIISLLLTFLGMVNIAVGCIDFCKQAKGVNNDNIKTDTFGSYQPQLQTYSQVGQTGYGNQNIQQNANVESTPNYINQVQSNNGLPQQAYSNQVQNNVGATQTTYSNQQSVNNEMVSNQQASISTGIPQNRQCPHCGNQVNMNSDTCFMCGNKI